MRRTISFLYLLSILLTVSLVSCHSSGDKNANGEEETNDLIRNGMSKEILITKAQFEADAMQLGDSDTVTFRQIVKGSGHIAAAPGGIARVSTLLPGRVSEIYIQPGDRVKKGERLIFIEGNELISLQQEYAASMYTLELLRSNYERQQLLAEENISARKELVRAENEYRSLLSSTVGLKAKLQILQLDPDKIIAGQIASGVNIVSPIKGYITEMDLVLGQVIEPNETVIEIIDPDQLQLNVHVYENDLDALQEGQEVRFYKPELPEQMFYATLESIGHAVDEKARTIHCLASLDKPAKDRFIQGLFVETEIITCERETEAIPEHALIQENDHYYVLEKSREEEEIIVFSKKLVDIGAIMDGYAEIKGESLKNVLIEGSYNLAVE